MLIVFIFKIIINCYHGILFVPFDLTNKKGFLIFELHDSYNLHQNIINSKYDLIKTNPIICDDDSLNTYHEDVIIVYEQFSNV